jgi:hypothetical protein
MKPLIALTILLACTVTWTIVLAQRQQPPVVRLPGRRSLRRGARHSREGDVGAIRHDVAHPRRTRRRTRYSPANSAPISR